MSLMEVNEALTVIQEAAHEEANIIFGAVVDPALAGQGQDHGDRHRLRPRVGHAERAGGAPMQTPVDLQSYTSHGDVSAQAGPGRRPSDSSLQGA